MIKELVQIQMRVQGFDRVSATLVALGGGHAGAGVDAGVIDTLQPEGELGVEFNQTAGSLARQAQAGFKILLDGEDHPLDFSLGPGVSEKFGSWRRRKVDNSRRALRTNCAKVSKR